MSTSLVRNSLDQVSADRIREHIRALEGVRHPVVSPDALEHAASYISDSLQSLGYEVEPHLFCVGDREFRNIIATCPGTRQPEERVMVLAHYDTMSSTPGADDNASGVAVLLELARVMKSLQFERTVQFVAVNLEENERVGDPGFLGSSALAARAKEEGWRIEGVVVLESVAYAGEAIDQKNPENLPIELPQFGNFIAVVGNQDSAELVETFSRATSRYQISLPIQSLVVPGTGEMFPDTRRSDHSPFWDRGFKAVMVTDTCNFRNPNYHQATDTLETLNVAFAAEVCRAVGGAVADVAGR
ncbi:M28 family peptidase [Candidatus Bipolaricaulota bacterium]